MKLNLDCIPCFQRQALETSRIAGADTKIQQEVLRKVIQKLNNSKWEGNTWPLVLQVHQIVRQVTGVKDPYKKIKQKHNQILLKLYPIFENKVNIQKDPLLAAIKLSIAGNIIDFGPQNKLNSKEPNLKKPLDELLKKNLAVNNYQEFKEKLKKSRKILFFLDNAGEIVLDRLLLETILKTKDLEKISLVVKAGPFLNDATLEDIKQINLSELGILRFLTVSNGDSNHAPKYNSDTVQSWIKQHDMTICKGQGNYEAFSDIKDLFFMLITKCPLVASRLGVDMGSFILKYNRAP